ncbi:hypothetical protein PGT21_034040 [Puccinia graminis f. sp. tritici]|uniref:Uncharacterized protein n=1 Tax=Puccinia graminis f. sp. tritici TaxID=56615 RepID=A0A5B0PMR9_PUCGR|nr:hypothetical protein PGT21_034040 [Puccinia graminis f. sp. tritici]
MTGSAILDIHDHTRRFIPKNRDVSSPYKHLKVFTDQGSSANIWDLLKKNHQNIVNAPNEWFDFKNMVQLLRNCPVLKYFTIFQLQGPKTHKEAVQILNTQGKAACENLQLESSGFYRGIRANELQQVWVPCEVIEKL